MVDHGIRKSHLHSVVLGAAVFGLVACGGKPVVDEVTQGPATSSSSSGGTTTTATTVPACGSLDEFCDCYLTSGCSTVGAGCLCPCDYECPGQPGCDCDCGGGDYLGCAPHDCPQVEFPEGSKVSFDDDGCPVADP